MSVMQNDIVKDGQKHKAWERKQENQAIDAILSRANLKAHVVSCAIIEFLARQTSMKFGDLHKQVCEKLGVSMKEKHFRYAISYTNEALRLINNLDHKSEVCIAAIYEITVEVDGNYFTRFALVHNQ